MGFREKEAWFYSKSIEWQIDMETNFKQNKGKFKDVINWSWDTYHNKIKFNTQTIKEFNNSQDTTLNESMSFDDAMCNIEDADNNYFYCSMDKDDVIEAYLNEEEIAEQLELYFVLIKELGIYIALQP